MNKDRSNTSNIVERCNNYTQNDPISNIAQTVLSRIKKDNCSLEEQIDALYNIIEENEKKRGRLPVNILVPVIALLWGIAYVKLLNFFLSIPAFLLGLALLRIAQKNYFKMRKIKETIKIAKELIDEKNKILLNEKSAEKNSDNDD